MTDVLTRTLNGAPAATPSSADRIDLAEPASLLAGTVAASLAIAVAPSTGRFRPLVHPGATVAAGDVIGHITGGRGRADEVRVPAAADVQALLARAGQLVTRGQGLAWLHRSTAETA